MKNVTLIIAITLISLTGFAQQGNNSKIEDTVEISIQLDNIVETDLNTAILFESNTHEFTHNAFNIENLKKSFTARDYSYNEYAVYFTYKPSTNNIEKA